MTLSDKKATIDTYYILTITATAKRVDKMEHKQNKNNNLTAKQMEQALYILLDSWVNMDGEQFGEYCLGMKYNDVKKSYINENFRRFQDDLGGQIAKTSGDYMTRLAAGLIEYHNNKINKKG